MNHLPVDAAISHLSPKNRTNQTTGVKVDLPTFTEKDVNDIVNFGIKNNVDFIAASFVRKASDVTSLKKLLKDNGGEQIHIISKIENQEGLENYQEILKETDGIMVARGDLGVSYAKHCISWISFERLRF